MICPMCFNGMTWITNSKNKGNHYQTLICTNEMCSIKEIRVLLK